MAVKSKVNLLEPASRSLSNRIFLAADLHGLCTVNKGLAPKVNQDLFEFRHCRTIAKKKRDGNCNSRATLLVADHSPGPLADLVTIF